METHHELLIADATRLAEVASGSVELVVTSPPYPMVEMWDGTFSLQTSKAAAALAEADGWEAFRRMHEVLDAAWREVHRVLGPGGLACINIGDATRTIGSSFALYPNHARVLSFLVSLGFTPLPAVLWRKETNAPNKFMGSGMLPPGAYVTLEHEYILIARKGGKREFRTESEKTRRRESAFFWEERNVWFSDVWFDLKGTGQRLAADASRERSGAFPFELAYRLVHMFSIQGDTVLDPFAGTGTTLLAAMACGRNSIGVERDAAFASLFRDAAESSLPAAHERAERRLAAHREFVASRYETKGPFGYRNIHYGFPVVTRQETALLIPMPASVRACGERQLAVGYEDARDIDESDNWAWFFAGEMEAGRIEEAGRDPGESPGLELFEPASGTPRVD